MRIAGHLGAAAVVLGLVTACSSTVTGSGSVAGGAPSSQPHQSSSSTTSPSSSASETTSSSASETSSSAAPTNCKGAPYCDDFSSSSSGWPRDHQPHYYADYDSSFGGTYHMGERFTATVSEDAPKSITAIAPDFGVQLDVDAMLGPSMPSGTGAGFTCWEHQTPDNKAYSAFIFEITDSYAEVYLWRDSDGKYFSVSRADTTVLRTGGAVNHLTATCTQTQSAGGSQAHLTMSVNGTEVLRAIYTTDPGTQPWHTGEGAGLIAVGKGSDVFYDNFAMRPATAS